MMIAEAFVAIRPQVDKATFQRDVTAGIAPGAQKAGEDAGKQLGEGMKKSVRSTVADLGAILGSIGAGVFLRDAFKVDEAAIVSQAKLTAILKSTGGEAGVTAEGVDKLSQSLSKEAAIADETIKNAAALLLSFRDIRNEAGKGNDIFDRTLKVSTDLSAAFGRDLQSSVVQLGRALENPAAGLTALTRSGITFSAQTRDQIKVLTEQGNLLGAQKVILDEVEKKFGGTAAAIAKADPFKRFSADLIVFKETVGQDLLPIADTILHTAQALFNVFEKLPGPIRGTAEGVVGLTLAGAGVSRMVGVLGGLSSAFFGVAASEEAAAVGAERVATENALAAASMTEVTAASDAAAASMGAASASFGQILGGLIIGIGAGAAAGSKLNQILAGSQPTTDAYAKSLDNLAKTGELSGTALDALGDHASKLKGDLSTIQGSTWEKAFGLAPSAHRAVADIKSVNDALISLGETQGKDAAVKALAAITKDLGGISAETATQLHPFLAWLDDAEHKSFAAGTGVQSLTDKLAALFGTGSASSDLLGKLGVEDAFQSAKDALDSLNQARLDAAGKGTKSAQAADAEASAYQSLASAQQTARNSSQSLADAQNSLADAQAKLAEFDNPTSSTIRALERTQIVRRHVVTPADVRQKEIDLLSFDQSHADTRANLLQAVAHAVEGVGKAEQGVADSTQRVADAQGKVSDATQKRKQVQVDALNSIAGLERKAEEQALTAGAAFAQWAKDTQPADDVLKSMLKTMQEIAIAAGDPGLATSLGNIAKSIVTSAAGAHQLTASLTAPLGSDPATGNSQATVDAYARAAYADRPASERSETLQQWARAHKIPGFALGGLADWPLGEARLSLLHGQEIVTPPGKTAASAPVEYHAHYHGGPPRREDEQYSMTEFEWRIARKGGRA